ncbi:MAG: phage tail tip lysozyme [Butyrivibrio sp.]
MKITSNFETTVGNYYNGSNKVTADESNVKRADAYPVLDKITVSDWAEGKGTLVDYSVSNTEITSAVKTSNLYALSATDKRTIQNNLKILGFYSTSKSSDGDLTSAESVKALKNFQKVYGLSVDGNADSATINRISSAAKRYQSVKNSTAVQDICTAYSRDGTQKKNLVATWTFLKEAMYLPDHQAAGVLGNIYQECRFNCTAVGGNESYGILQWQGGRGTALQNYANSMVGVSKSDINAQLGYMRAESLDSEKSNWAKVKGARNYEEAARLFCNYVERPNDDEAMLDVRIDFAKYVYNAFN